MTDNIQPEQSTIEQMIDRLPERFPDAVEMIKYEVAPHLIECDSGLRDHYIKIIKKKTKAASIKSVSLLIDEVTEAINESVAEKDEGEIKAPDPEIVTAAEEIAKDPLLFKKKIDIVNELGVVGERKIIGIYQLVMDSRLVPMGFAGSEALAMKNSGHYGAGKSFPLFTSLKLYPKTAYHLISSGSEKSLYSMEGGLQYKALILAEALALESKGSRDNELAYGIRTLVSEGQLKYQITGFKDKKRVTVIKKIAGPTSLLTTTISGKLEDQLDDRMITVHPNTSAGQTKDIIDRTADSATGGGSQVDEKILKAWQHYHGFLLSLQVVIPFAPDIASFISGSDHLQISARRAFKRFLSGIKTIALLYQKQRSRDMQGRLIAEITDYFIAYQLLEESFAESMGGRKRYTDKRISLIEKEGRITVRDLADKAGVSTAAISQWLKPMIEKGVLKWCDEHGADFEDDLSLERAKRLGKAFIRVSGGNSLPTAFELTGDPRWERGGELYEAFDLGLNSGVDELDQRGGAAEEALIRNERAGSEEDRKANESSGVKVLSEKSNTEIKKMLEEFRQNQEPSDLEDPELADLSREFENLLSGNQSGVLN